MKQNTMFAKKSLGQHFLKSDFILSKIISAGKVNKEDVVLEIGPGRGDLTKKLLENSEKVIAVEKDHLMIPVLSEKFSEEISIGRLLLINDDILNFEPAKLKLKTNKFKLIANIPYYLTGKIFRKFLEADIKPSLMVLLVQKEVADRIISEKGSLLSISVKAFGKPKKITNVNKSYFKPAPKVDSAILLIDKISDDLFEKISKEKFFLILKAGFKQKRKKLISNLKSLYEKENLEKTFKECSLSENTRAEELSIEKWLYLSQNLTLH